MKDALLAAAEKGELEIVKALLQKGAKIDSSDSRGVTPLMRTCLYGHKHIIEELLHQGVDVKHISDFGGVLSHATGARGNPEIIKLLISAGADVHERNLIYENETPLFCACRVGRPDLAKILLEAGADVNAKNDLGNTPLWEVCATNRDDIPGDLQQIYPQVVKLLIDYGADVSLYDEFSSILTTACDTDSKNVADIVCMILKAGNLQMLGYKDGDGLTALDIAKKHKNVKLIRMLTQAEKE
ncbi:MAG: ankyrin repeat domain-containing protein [Elusimicrobiaceae bacterium]|nr:ankyrin repeat domain-containing protein [Elusimicrobiaceae bacterium]